ncbi:melanocortin-2 receptor accessory protein 2 [Ambystoma mexicanum]|uniref:melanocortin-2 receptor accessory protein 2 n=1 Tax=Ambystoma mexicanum TaxID=8296 RepID=UPI0037E93A48
MVELRDAAHIPPGPRLEMAGQSSHSNKTSQTDYTWEYEYYDYPISFEGLKAHKYSIVIGFWVGLAVFVIFMFFVLTLLTKTGAPHQENAEPSEKLFRMSSFAAEFGRSLEPDKMFSHQGIEESRSLFHCYINEVEQLDKGKPSSRALGLGSSTHRQEAARNCKLEEELHFLVKFNIPNSVNTDHASSLVDDDLLIGKSPIYSENKPVHHNLHHILK